MSFKIQGIRVNISPAVRSWDRYGVLLQVGARSATIGKPTPERIRKRINRLLAKEGVVNARETEVKALIDEVVKEIS